MKAPAKATAASRAAAIGRLEQMITSGTAAFNKKNKLKGANKVRVRKSKY